MTLAAETREALGRWPFLHEALRADVLNYSAVARFLDVDTDDEDAVVAALRRYAAEVPAYRSESRDVRVTMKSGLGQGDPDEALVVVGDLALVPDEGSSTAIVATGAVDATALGYVLRRLDVADVPVEAAGAADDVLTVVVGRRHGADVVRLVEDALTTVPVSA